MQPLEQLFAYALARHHAGDLDAARRAYADLLTRQPDHADALHMVGLLQHQEGDHAAALRLLETAHANKPGDAAILANRAGVQLALGRYAAAEADAGAALVSAPGSFAAALNLGLARAGLGRHDAAAAAFAQASARRPDDARALLEWFAAAARSGRASGLAERVRQPLPALAAWRERVLATAAELERQGLSNPAFALLARLRSELPDDAEVRQRFEIEARYRHACACEYRNDSDGALAAAEAVIAFAPSHYGARALRASLLGERGIVTDALAEHERLLALAPDNAAAGSAYLIALQHDPAQSAAAIANAHRAWAQRHCPAPAPRWPRDRGHADPERPLRIGWLSPRFFAGLAQTFFAADVARLDRATMTHVLYDSGGIGDAGTAQFHRAADLWRRVDAFDDAQLCAQIRADRIDVLVELSGHSPHNRLIALGARPAPVQVSWLDYFHSTGTRAIDVLLSDRMLSPPELLGHYSERVLWLASGRLCYAPPEQAPAVSPRPGDDRLRLACFNRLAKINDEVLATWSRLLAALPAAVLKLKTRAFDDPGHRANLLARALAHGIGSERLELLGYGTHVETLAAYADVDIALDPFPFSGCATSCDALWMGVPVVTRIGETMVSRQTASLLNAVALDDLIAGSGEEYVERVLGLAGDDERRHRLRRELRQRARAGFGDVDRHAGELSAALRSAWRAWCAGERAD